MVKVFIYLIGAIFSGLGKRRRCTLCLVKKKVIRSANFKSNMQENEKVTVNSKYCREHQRTRFILIMFTYLTTLKWLIYSDIASIRKGQSIPYNLVFLFNAGQGFFLCNVGEIWPMLAWHLQQLYHQKINRFKIKIAEGWYCWDDIALFFPCEMLSRVSWVTLHRYCALSQEY